MQTDSGVPRRGLRGVRTPPLAYDLRNKRARMRQNMIFSTKNKKNFMERGHIPLPRPFPTGEGIPPPHTSPPRRMRHIDPSHYKMLDTSLQTDNSAK